MIIHHHHNGEFKESFEVEVDSDDGKVFVFSSFRFPPASLVASFVAEDGRRIDVSELGHQDRDEGRLFFFRASYF
jgi:hypothetical protein